MTTPNDPLISFEQGGAERSAPMLQQRFFRFIGHELIATVGSFVAGFVLLSAVSGVVSPRSRSLALVLLISQYSPCFWLSGLLLGFVINNYTKTRTASWLGIINLALFGAMLVADVIGQSPVSREHPWMYECGQLFSLDNGDCGPSECLGKLIIVPPLLGSIAYSIGATLALRGNSKRTTA